jgi:hypothetical protein
MAINNAATASPPYIARTMFASEKLALEYALDHLPLATCRCISPGKQRACFLSGELIFSALQERLRSCGKVDSVPESGAFSPPNSCRSES